MEIATSTNRFYFLPSFKGPYVYPIEIRGSRRGAGSQPQVCRTRFAALLVKVLIQHILTMSRSLDFRVGPLGPVSLRQYRFEDPVSLKVAGAGTVVEFLLDKRRSTQRHTSSERRDMPAYFSD